MTGLAQDGMMLLLRATALLAVSALLVRGLIWWLRPSSPTVQRAAWFLVLVQGMVLFHLPIEVAWYEHQRQDVSPPVIRSSTGVFDEVPSTSVIPPAEPVAISVADDPPPPEAARASAQSSAVRELDWTRLGMVIWFAGVVCLPILLGLTYVRFLWCLSAGRPAPESWSRQWQSLLAAQGVRRLIPLRVAEEIGPALCWTPRGYCVFVPGRVWADLTSSQRKAILRHELAHLQRGDLWKTQLLRLLALPHWFNPFAWWAVRRQAECAEWACDQAAAGPRRAAATEYAKALLRLGSADLSSASYATAVRGGPLSIRIRRLISARLSEDSVMKKAILLTVAAGLVALNLIRVELTAKEPTVGPPHQAGASSGQGTSPTVGPDLPAEQTTVVAGRVLDADGKPVADAQVGVVGRSRRPHRGGDLGSSGPKPIGGGETDDQGRFRVAVPRIVPAMFRSADVVAAKSGYSVGWEPLALEAEQHDVVIRLGEEQPLRGRVVDDRGRPAADARVYVTWLGRMRFGKQEGVGPRFSQVRFPTWPDPATTDDQGRFAIRGVNRRYTVKLYVSDHRFATWDFFIKPLGEKPPERDPKYEERTRYLAKASEYVYPEDPSEELTLSPPPAQIIEGRVVYADTNQPAAHARLTAYARQIKFGSAVGVPGRADAHGRFRLNPYPGKFFDIRAYPPNGQPYLILKKTLTWPEGAARQKTEVALPRGVLVRGKITEEPSGGPVEGAAVEYYDASKNPHVPEDIVTQWQGIVVSDAHGTFQTAVPAGKGTLLVHGPTPDYVQQIIGSNEVYYGRPGGRRYYVHASIPLDPQPGAEAPDAKASLQRGVTVRGRLVGPPGKAVDEALMLTHLYMSPSDVDYRASAVKVREGRFQLPGCHPEKSTSVYFLDPKNELGAAVKVSGRMAGDEPLEVRLLPCGAAEARFVDMEGKPLVDYEPNLKIVMTPGHSIVPYPEEAIERGEWLADEDFVANFDRLNYWEGPVTDKQGRCTLPALIPGVTYRLSSFDKASSKWVSKDFSVASGKVLQLPDIVIKRDE